MTYRQSFNHLAQPRNHTLRRHYRKALMRWLTVAVVITLWGLLTGWLDGAV